MQKKLEQQVKDLNFLLQREKKENKVKIKDILFRFLEIYDAQQKLIEIALTENWEEEPKKFIKERFSLVSKKILQAIQRSGAMKINSLNQPVNYEYHQVIEKKNDHTVPENQIIEVKQDGFMYQGEVLRQAKVVIAANPNIMK